MTELAILRDSHVDATAPKPGWRRAFPLRQPVLTLSLLVLAALLFAAAFPDLIATHPPTESNLSMLRQPPSADNLLGTDQLGRDVFSRVVYGARVTLLVGILSTTVSVVVGSLLGLAAGYFRGWIDAVLMRFSDIMLAFPAMLLALAIIGAAGPNYQNLILAVGVAHMPGYAKLMRNQVRAVNGRGFIEAATASGSRRRTIVFAHLLPNAYSPLLGLATLGIGISILIASSLSYLGLGPPPPTFEWGAMVSDGSAQIANAWWMSLFPGLAIVVTVLVFGTVGRYLRQRFDLRSGESQ